MSRSIPSRIENIRRVAESRAAAPIDVQVDLVTADTREEALALLGLPPTPPPQAGRIRIHPVHCTAAEYLNQLGSPTLPPPT
jgi:hypothetical protein